MKRILILTFALFAAAAVMLAADATGTWTGTFTVKGDGDSPEPRPALLVLKQDGDKLTGTAGPNADEQHPIEKGVIADGKITFEVAAGESIMKFALVLNGDEISGDIQRDRDGEHQTAKLAVKRQK
ncbi:hypothetical protein [uncultured Paludibaculum sp.]|uniref:hypothetical protein n=1 Tax=uncultured Paludibaculum sp. TaxID=1765020 RepID=UPI002AAA6FFF|nr:hypothetical protein [uncultured Paludibaculum sp.]